MKNEQKKPSKGCKIRFTSNMMLCIPFFILWGVYMLLGAAMTPLSPMDESYKVMETVERYIGIAICAYVCIYSLVCYWLQAYSDFSIWRVDFYILT